MTASGNRERGPVAAFGVQQRFELTHDRFITPIILMTMFALSILFYPEGFTPFIYFQF